MAIVVCFVEEWTLEQCLPCMKMLAKSMTGEDVAREPISMLSVKCGVKSELLAATRRDKVSVNNLAMQTAKVVCLLISGIGCFLHTFLVSCSWCHFHLTGSPPQHPFISAGSYVTCHQAAEVLRAMY